jgi:hypothetical protein
VAWGNENSGAPVTKTALTFYVIINVGYNNTVGRGPLRRGGLGQIAPLAPLSAALRTVTIENV